MFIFALLLHVSQSVCVRLIMVIAHDPGSLCHRDAQYILVFIKEAPQAQDLDLGFLRKEEERTTLPS